MNWREIIRDSRVTLFPGDYIATLGEEYEVIEITLSNIEVRYKLANFRTGAALEATLEELKKWEFRRIEWLI